MTIMRGCEPIAHHAGCAIAALAACPRLNLMHGVLLALNMLGDQPAVELWLGMCLGTC